MSTLDGVMTKTRISLFYLSGYLSLTGLALMFFPIQFLKLLFATGDYGDVMPRFLGIMMLALGLVVSQIIRFRVDRLYPITVMIRLVIWFFILWLYYYSGDPFFLVVLGVLGLGIVLTATCYLQERRSTA
ncbi:MAG: hypothetical protein R2729_10980 [Bryobacteraceae bacterium]